MCHPEVGLVGGQPPVSPPQPRVLLLHSARRLDPSFPSQGGTAGSHPVVSGEWPGLAHVAYGHPPASLPPTCYNWGAREPAGAGLTWQKQWGITHRG